MGKAPYKKADAAFEPAPGITLESVLSTSELAKRALRPPDYRAENDALRAIAQHLADSPRTVLQKLVEIAMESCRAGSAGISFISEETGDFYWPAVAGAWKPQIGGGTPRDFGPCGIVLDRNAPQLFTHPEIYYPYLAQVTPPIAEVLLTPFFVQGKAVGTVWLVAHDAERKFDAEDQRLIENLSRMAAAAHTSWMGLEAQKHALKREHNLLEKVEQNVTDLRDINAALLISSARQHELIEKLQVAQEALSFLGLVVASSNESIVTIDFDRIITTWNAAA